MALGHHSEDLPVVDDSCHVVEPGPEGQRQAYDDDQVIATAEQDYRGKPFDSRLLQGLLQEQVSAGITGQAELRQHDQPRPALGGTLHQVLDALHVVRHIRDLDDG